MRKFLRIVTISFLVFILFRGIIYRSLVKYHEIGERIEIKITSETLINKIEKASADKILNTEVIAEISNSITNEELSFTSRKASNNPNDLINTKLANCIGYSAMFNSIANYLINKNGLNGKIEVNHKIGHLDLFGKNLNQIFKSPFFKDHDYNEIIDLNTGEHFFVDPTVSDYLGINRVSSK